MWTALHRNLILNSWKVVPVDFRSRMSCSIRVCDAADDKEQLRCLRRDAEHAQAHTFCVQRSLFSKSSFDTFITVTHTVD